MITMRDEEIGVALSAVAGAAESLRKDADALQQAVVGARFRGATWSQIGEVVGISRQSAHERWGHLQRPAGCRHHDCDCPEHQVNGCPCGHGPGRGYAAKV